MPYIKKLERPQILNSTIKDFTPENAGEFQFVIATILNNYYLKFGLSYQKCNDIMGALAGAEAEHYRQVVAPYEDNKMFENGDVYDVNTYKRSLTPSAI